MGQHGTLVLFCGKMGSGKSTKAVELAETMGAILLSEDDWLARLYPGEIHSLKDYVTFSSRLKSVIQPHVQSLLGAGVSVVMDFPGNTGEQRARLKEIFQEKSYPHRLVYLEADDALCLRRLELRRRSHPERAGFDTPEVFQRVTAHFEAPSPDEGFHVEIIRQSDE